MWFSLCLFWSRLALGEAFFEGADFSEIGLYNMSCKRNASCCRAASHPWKTGDFARGNLHPGYDTSFSYAVSIEYGLSLMEKAVLDVS